MQPCYSSTHSGNPNPILGHSLWHWEAQGRHLFTASVQLLCTRTKVAAENHVSVQDNSVSTQHRQVIPHCLCQIKPTLSSSHSLQNPQLPFLHPELSQININDVSSQMDPRALDPAKSFSTQNDSCPGLLLAMWPLLSLEAAAV